MKYAFAGLALAAIASAQSLSDIPSCALTCIQDAVTSSTSCSVSDYACVCENQSTLTSAASPCVISSCGADVAVNDVLPAVQKFCTEVEAAGSSSSSAAAAPTSSEAAATSSAASYPTSSEVAVSSSTTCTGAASTVTSFTTATSTGACHACNGTVSTAYPTSAYVTAGAAHVAGPVGGVAALLLGALAVF